MGESLVSTSSLDGPEGRGQGMVRRISLSVTSTGKDGAPWWESAYMYSGNGISGWDWIRTGSSRHCKESVVRMVRLPTICLCVSFSLSRLSAFLEVEPCGENPILL